MRPLLCSLTAVLALPVLLHAQDSTSLHAAPDGVRLAAVLDAAGLTTGARRGDWRELTVEGWIWAASVRPEARDGYDLLVVPVGGENLRAQPNGRVIARLRQGMLLDRLAEQGPWLRVRRTGWVRERPGTAAKAAPSDPQAAATSAPSAPALPPGSTGPAAGARGWARAGQGGAALLGRPRGDTLALIRPLGTLEVITREANWARVRLEGWVWAPALAAPADSAVLRHIAAATVMANPDRFQGRLLEWPLQFIALERAEKIRTDFYEGEPFILTRGPADETGFVYLAVPPHLLDQARRLTPLQRVLVLGRVRTAKSPIMGAPVLDLVELK
ncbi:MAG: hypothetical protein HY561_03470 [Gemmatimonadetes bacterium]|nr:hypothetical protein [Gemmatimonadota bacterium]